MCYERRDPNIARECWEREQGGKKMAEYIESTKMADVIHRYFVGYKVEDMIRDIRKEATADVAPVVHGRWIGLEYDGYADGCPVYDLWECSECGEEVSGDDVPTTHPWCHGCGARMDGEG